MLLAIQKQPLDKRAAAVLRERILNGQFGPGFRLVETWLAGQFGLSRSTVRAALSELSREGLVTQIAYTKWIVTEISGEDIWELFNLRGALEGLGARTTAQKITPESSRVLSEAYKKLVRAASGGDRAAVTEADFDLHKLIIDLSGHRRLREQYRLIEQQVRLVIASSNALLSTTEQITRQHEPIVKAILAGQGANAERLIRHHNLSEGKVLRAHVQASRPVLASAPNVISLEPPVDASRRSGRRKKQQGQRHAS